ncbi:FecR family protein [Lacibacter sediminis]|uniref:FecR family protein n=1 Tax=Lacibacter sediminis TaxID=2760713 RepID=A0A7G5XL23_9BACT|nr:FecR family protein [Lacibacter sediminis]QNA46176.1 FecR family protein [Lacibacter sediminis]
MSRDKIWHLFSRKLANEASIEELHELQQLLEDNPTLFHEMEAIEQLWNSEAQEDSDYLEATYHLHYEKMKKLGIEPKHIDEPELEPEKINISFFTPKRKKAIAMVSLFAVTVIAFFFIKKPSAEESALTADVAAAPKEVATKNGVSTKMLLPDGSTVWLNAGSKLDYTRIGKSGNREVQLTGEAFFDIVKNPERPFIIHTSKIDVKVLGTKFNVKAYPDDKTVETSLVQGSVEVFVKNRPGEKYLLKPNQKLVLLNNAEADVLPKATVNKSPKFPIIAIDHLTYRDNDTMAVETSWMQNKLVFEDEAFAEVARKMERWYDVRIQFRNRSLEDELLNGDFRKETLKQALDALRITTDFRYKIEDKTVLIY